MISPTSITSRYSLQPNLLDKHRESLVWLSHTAFWKTELGFFQKLLDETAPNRTSVEEKKDIDHFQNLILYYQGELIDTFRKELRAHENELAKALQHRTENNTEYLTRHDAIVEQLKGFENQFADFKKQFLAFIEQGF